MLGLYGYLNYMLTLHGRYIKKKVGEENGKVLAYETGGAFLS